MAENSKPFGLTAERNRSIDKRVAEIVTLVQKLTHWGVEVAGKTSYLFPEGVLPNFPGGEERPGVMLHQGISEAFDRTLLEQVYSRLGLSEQRESAVPARISREQGVTADIVGYRTTTDWGIELLELQELAHRPDHITITELWATKD
jgi:hypothetical protein